MTIRWGIIGCGDVVRKRVAAAIQMEGHSQLQAACRRNHEELADFCQQFGVPQAFPDERELIDTPDIDAVYIATPVSLHCSQTVAAAQQGKHVLVEKPMAISVEECNAMIDACQQADVQLGVAYYRPFYPVIERMRQIIASGDLGDLMSLSAVTSTDFRATPEFDGRWRADPILAGGGALMDVGSHRIDVFLRLGGPIQQVKAVCGTVAAEYAVEDCASTIFQFASGAHGHLQCYFGTTADVDELTIIGTRGRLVSSPLNAGRLHVRLGHEERHEEHPPHDNFNAPLIADFVDAIRQGHPPRVTGADGRAVNDVMGRAYRDAK